MAYYLSAVLIVSAVFSKVTACPENCTCTPYANGMDVTCSNRGLQYIPTDLPISTIRLVFQNNKISTLNVKLCDILPGMIHLDMFNNQIEQIPDGYLQGCNRLEILSLSYNKLTAIHEDTFTNMSKLQMLELTGMPISTIPQYAFSELGALQTLHLEYNEINAIEEKSFVNLRKLESLYLSNNAIQSIENNSFVNLTSLRDLKLDNNQIQAIKGYSFVNFPSLSNLDLQSNQIQTIEEYSFVDLLSLSSLNLKNNQLKVIKEYSFVNVPGLSVILSSNKIQLIEKCMFVNFPSLSWDLSGNLIQVISNKSFVNFTEFYRLDLRMNQIQVIEEYSFVNLSKLNSLDLSGNRIPAISKYSFVNLENLNKLYLSSNQIQAIEDNSFVSLPGLTYLYLSNNRIQAISKYSFMNLTGLNQLYLSSNQIQVIEDNSFVNLPSLNYLDLSGNRIPAISKYSFVNLKNLQKLNLSSNQFQAIQEHSFVNLPKLQYLWLENNQIKTIEKYSFVNMTSLSNLYLQNNQIQVIKEYSFWNVPSLFVTLSSNQIQSIEECIFVNLPSSSWYLSGNQIRAISRKSFANFTKFDRLDVSNNQIQVIGEYSFVNLPSLIYLDVSNNQIQVIEEYSFVNLKSLGYLKLNNNLIQVLEGYSFVNLPSLTNFDLSLNKIQTISQYSFVNLTALRKLNLSEQKIHTIEDYSFVNLWGLRELQLGFNNLTVIKSHTCFGLDNLYILNLYGNKISLIESDAFVKNPYLKYLNLTLNPFNCGCSIFPFWSWLKRSAVNVTSATCSDGREVISIRSSELKNCNTSLVVSADITSYNPTIGMNVTLNCVVTSGIATNITWYKDKRAISISKQNRNSGGTVNEPQLTIINVQRSDQGNYVCQATDLVDNVVDTLTITMVVRAPLAVAASITSYNPTIGTNVTLNCVITSGIANNITWYKDNTSIDISTDNRYSGGTVQTPLLTMINVQQSDKGNYVCQAEDSVEIVKSPTITLVVRAPLAVTAYNTSYNPRFGTNVTLNCAVTSGIATNITWYKDNTTIILSTNSRHFGGTVQTPSLTIISLQQSDAGSYVCQARDSVETVYTPTITLVVRVSCDGTRYYLDWGIEVNFPPESFGSSISSTEVCITDKKNLATADCILRNGQLPTLSNILVNPKCIFNTFEKSNVTKSIQNLTTISVDNNNVQAVVQMVKNLTSDPSILTSIDIISVADVLVHVSKLPLTSKKVVDDVFDIIDSVINVNVGTLETAQSNGSATNRLLEVLNKVSTSLDIGRQRAARFLRDNILMDVYDVSDMMSPVIGIQIESDELEPLSNNTVKTITYVDEVNVGTVDAAIILPVELIKGLSNSTRVSLTIYRNWNLFSVRSDIKQYRPNSRIIAASITRDGFPIHFIGQYKVQALFYPRVNTSDIHVVCGYWDYDLHENSGGWAKDGCVLNRTESGRFVCICDHLTNFAIIVNIGEQDTLVDSLALKIISYIGLILSIFGLSLTVLSFIFLKHLRRGRGQQTLFNLALSLLFFLIVFISGVTQTHDFDGCIAVAVLLHYFILVAFMWMLMEGILQYLRFVKVLGTYIPSFMLKTGVSAWGVPLIPVIIVLALDYKKYHGGSKACWMSLSVFYYSFIVPVSAIVLANIIIFIMILKNLLSPPKRLHCNQPGKKRAIMNLFAALSVLVVLGLTWIFGFFTIEGASVVFQYIFTILNVFQGFFIFVLFTAREEQVRHGWKKLCCRRKSREQYSKTDTSSTENNTKKSTGIEFSSI